MLTSNAFECDVIDSLRDEDVWSLNAIWFFFPIFFFFSFLGATVRGSTLILSNVKANDAGIYVCKANNTMNTEEISTILTVNGLIPKFQSSDFMELDALNDAYLTFDIEIAFKPEHGDGLILFKGQNEKIDSDYVSFGLEEKYPVLR